ncbi:MAG: inositol monophosphatase [Neisseriales bacterium]|nr:MAG: inositol monophosphatase [Neisseriales bacterium]
MHPMLNVAIKAARRGASVIRHAASKLDGIAIEKKDNDSIVTEVDRTAEEAIIGVILEAYPTHTVLAEESGFHLNQDATYQWFIDPLDGTTNFIHGHPQYAVSIALAHENQIEQAVVYDIERNNLFTATRGAGAYLNDRRIHVAKHSQLNAALLATSIPTFNPNSVHLYFNILRDMVALQISTRNEGSAVLDLCHVACGQIDGYFALHLKPWDMAAGALIVQEAGGLITDPYGEDHWQKTGHIVASNPKLLAQLLHIITPHMVNHMLPLPC